MRFILSTLLFVCCVSGFSQNEMVKGVVHDAANNPISFANVTVSEVNNDGEVASNFLKGTTTDELGSFEISGLQPGKYQLSIRYIGYTEVQKIVTAPSDLGVILLEIAAENLNETVVMGRRPTIQKTMGRLVFNVENSSLSVGNSLELLKKTPGVLVQGDAISIQNRPTQIYLNDKRVYLSSTEIATFLKNLDAATIKTIEVVTIPTANYDAESGTILNISTSRALLPGYKGSVNGTYEQATFPKYQVGTSHFYKNNWINLFGSYIHSPRKEIKEDENFIRFFEPNGNTSSIWEGDFTRITRSQGHQGNLVADFTIDDKNTISLSSTVFVSPNKKYRNVQQNDIFDSQRQLDSTFFTRSTLNNDTHNISFTGEYVLKVGDKGAQIAASSNYISYESDQSQDLRSDYFLPNDDFIRTNSFFTNALQRTDILVGKIDAEMTMWEGSFATGVKYSNIDTESGLDFFDTENNNMLLNEALSDLFLYKESIFAGYVTFSKSWDKLSLSAGLRAEYTDVEGDSRTLGLVNTQEYFEWFPTISLDYQWHEHHGIGLAYKRAIERPRYQSLNPFKYFINENNFNAGNPNLIPSIENKITLSYSLRNKFFIEAYYQTIDSSLELLTFQDNINQTFRQIDANSLQFLQYSLDFIFYDSLTTWWYTSAVTSTYYLESEFFALESAPETFTNDTFGFYAQLYNSFTLTKDRSITSDVSALYISNFIGGSTEYKNQFSLSVSMQKSFWNGRATVFLGVDDIFNTNNVRVTSRYLNQDNSYFPRIESRLFRAGFTYKFGNFHLRNNNRSNTIEEKDRLQNP